MSLDQLVTDATTRSKSRPIVLSFIRNLRRIEGKTPITAFPGLFDGATVVLAGAGPSLDESLPTIKEHRSHCIVVCVQTALGAFRHAGIEPDFVFSMESVDVSSHLDGYEGHVIASLNAHQNVLDRAQFYVPSYNSCLHRSLHILHEGRFALGSRPYHLGPSAVTGQLMVVQECLRGPGTRVLLVGHDLSYPGLYTQPQPAYATGAGWSGMTVRLDAEQGYPVLVFEGREDRDEIHIASDQQPIGRTKQAYQVESLDPQSPGEWTSADLAHQVEFLEKYYAKDSVVNCTERGAFLRGYSGAPIIAMAFEPHDHVNRSMALNRLGCHRTEDGPHPHPDLILADAREQCLTALHLAKDLLDAPDRNRLLAGCPLVEQYVAGEMMDLRDKSAADKLGAVREMYATFERGALELLEVIDDAG